MRDFPVFTTPNGVASLVFKEIPYKGVAFVTIRDTQCPDELLKECVDFSKIAGANKVYATGHTFLQKFPLHTQIWQMRCLREDLPAADGALFPVTEETLDAWREIYNRRMAGVDNAATMTKAEGEKLLDRGAGYFVHKDGTLLGIGIAEADKVEAVASVVPGAGQTVMLTLCGCIFSESIQLEVASTNKPALRLYEKLGFIKTAELSSWYDVTEVL